MKTRNSNRLVMGLSLIILLVLVTGVIATNRSFSGANSLAVQAIPPLPMGPVASGDGQPDPVNPGEDRLINPGDLPGSMVVGYAAQMDVSPPLREIFPQLPEPFTTIREIGVPGETEQIGPLDIRPEVPDPVLQDTFSGLPGESIMSLAPAPSINFEGVGNVNGVYPPDTNGDVGPNHYLQMVNLSFQVWDKNGNSLYGPVNSNTVWSGFGAPCETQNDGDPIVLYDQIADRWILSQFTASNPYGECVAVSASGDPTGSYYRYFFQFSTTQFYDYPKLGVWPDGYYLTANRFTSFFQGASAIALERDKMLLGQPARFVEFKTTTSYGSLLPTDLDGATLPPAGSPNFILERGSSVLHLWKFHVDWVNTANSTFTGPANISIASYNVLCSGTRSCVPQPGTSVKLDAIGDRLMHRLAYRNFGTHESLVVNHSVDADSTTGVKAAVRWYEIRNPNGTPTVYQQGTFAPDADHRWMGSIAMDRDGNIGLVYSVASSSVYPSIRYTGRLASDALGTLPQGETTLIAGSGSQTGTASRWGDYAMIAVDPVDDCTFWLTTEYIQTTGTAPWKTRIGAFKFPTCGSASPTATPTSVPPTATPTNTALPPTATFTPGPTPTNTAVPPTPTNTTVPPTPTPTNTPAPVTGVLYLSSTTSGTAGGVGFADEDILRYTLSTGTYEMYFDGSDVGVGGVDVDAFDLQADGTLLLSFDAAVSVTGLGTVADADIVRFTPTSLGSTTAGTFSWYFDGSDVGLSTTSEDIDAVGFTADGKLVVSTIGAFSVTGASGNDEDLFAFTPTSLGSTTSGTWQFYFDGSDVGLSSTSAEDVNGVYIEGSTGLIYLTTLGTFGVTGVSGDGADIFTCTPGSLGSTTSCSFAMFWDGSTMGFSGEVLDVLAIVK